MSLEFLQKINRPWTQELPETTLYSWVQTQPMAEPRLLTWSSQAASQCLDVEGGLSPDDTKTIENVFSGNQIPEGVRPYSTRYGGHQFGHWAGQLGDGRATFLGEYTNSRQETYEIQLKGAGLTPYSRHADGRAVLRSSIREFICSEAMHSLGVPTTRALCCLQSCDQVIRDMFYDGHPELEYLAITTRLAPSFLRFGHFEILAESPADQRRLIRYAMDRYFPEAKTPEDMFHDVCDLTAVLLVHWMSLGFVHGVMNTDNMSLLGLTLDYGPFGWLDCFEANWTPNTTDFRSRRYSYQNQPAVAAWNLKCLAESLLGSNLDASRLEFSLNHFQTTFQNQFYLCLSQKLGLDHADSELIEDLLEFFAESRADMVLFFRELAECFGRGVTDEKDLVESLVTQSLCYHPSSPSRIEHLRQWIRKLKKKTSMDPSVGRKMLEINPVFVPRNYIMQTVIDDIQLKSDLTSLHRVQKAMLEPYVRYVECEDFYQPRPEWAKTKPGCAVLSCSS